MLHFSIFFSLQIVLACGSIFEKVSISFTGNLFFKFVKNYFDFLQNFSKFFHSHFYMCIDIKK